MAPSRNARTCESTLVPLDTLRRHAPRLSACPACAQRARPLLSRMPRKPPVQSIPEKPTGNIKQPDRHRIAPKAGQGDQVGKTAQFDLWDAFAKSREGGEMVEAPPARPSKPSRRRRSSKP